MIGSVNAIIPPFFNIICSIFRETSFPIIFPNEESAALVCSESFPPALRKASILSGRYLAPILSPKIIPAIFPAFFARLSHQRNTVSPRVPNIPLNARSTFESLAPSELIPVMALQISRDHHPISPRIGTI